MAEYLDKLRADFNGILDVRHNPEFVVARRSVDDTRVSLVSGCGGGHEPLCSGFVGEGMLDAACPGGTFGSPTTAQIVEASKAVASKEGVMHIVPHFKRDAEAFQTAADTLREAGIRVRDVIIDDDIALRDPRHTEGRRALGTVIAAARICGAAARSGYRLNRLAQLCKQVNVNGKSLAATLFGADAFHDTRTEVEIGIGLNGEPGIERRQVRDCAELTALLTERIISDGPFMRYVTEWDVENWRWHEVEVHDTSFRSGDRVIGIVSSLGETPVCDLDGVCQQVTETAAARGVTLERVIFGHFMSAKNPAGVAITLVKVDDEMLKFWDAPVRTAALETTG